MAAKANMTVAERQQYEEEWKIWNDYYNTLDYARKEGLEQGLEEGRKEGKKEGILSTARNLKAAGISREIIMQTTGLSAEEIDIL